MSPLLLSFCATYGIKDIATFDKLYEVEEMVLFLPANPTEVEKQALQELIGIKGLTYGFMDYVKSNNSFELIMQWKEKLDYC
ncbi:hypothetical protein Q0590_34570 [Rhodocytophaga aerolata]|uniref:Uncharacterized protein n=1 Tax=Rhodocytophaga aerolata TaxID=455078 RepID=A0ABT8RK74_9BACT|nr:hypothetical protein [Rhodocytophaga aerolata]MDO1451450.1 hypothetical protein [Rhodocytophaga aerolata]